MADDSWRYELDWFPFPIRMFILYPVPVGMLSGFIVFLLMVLSDQCGFGGFLVAVASVLLI